MMMMRMMMPTDVRLCCKGLLCKYEPISGASQVPVDNFPILINYPTFPRYQSKYNHGRLSSTCPQSTDDKFSIFPTKSRFHQYSKTFSDQTGWGGEVVSVPQDEPCIDIEISVVIISPLNLHSRKFARIIVSFDIEMI